MWKIWHVHAHGSVCSSTVVATTKEEQEEKGGGGVSLITPAHGDLKPSNVLHFQEGAEQAVRA
eukprot:COSAG05_NODE_26314_length_189_cov_31.388889_1_plen_62_part_11